MDALQIKQRDQILAAIHNHVKQYATLQEAMHQNVLVPIALYTFKYKSCHLVDELLNGLLTVKGGVRVEAVAYWFQHVAGIYPEYSKKLQGYTSILAHKNKQQPLYQSEVLNNGSPIKFTYDVEHLNICKKPKFRFWAIAPVEVKELKVRTELDKITKGVEVEMARALATSGISQDALKAHIDAMFNRVNNLAGSSKIKLWVAEFAAQNTQVKDTVSYEELPDAVIADTEESLGTVLEESLAA